MLFDNKLCWNENTSSIIQKVNTRMYCLRKLRSFSVSTALSDTFYNAVVALFAGEGISPNTKGEDWITGVKKGGQIVGICGQSTEDIYFKRLRCQLANILKDFTHPLYSEFDSRRIVGNGRLRTPMTRSNRLKCSVVPCALSVFKSTYDRA